MGNKAANNTNSSLSFFPIACAGFASMVSMRVCDALLPELARSFQVSTGTAANTISFFVIAYGVMQLIFGTLGDRYGKQRMIAVAVSLSAVINIALIFSPTIDVMSALRGAAGGAAAGIIPLCMAYIGDTVPYDKRQEVLARFMSATIIGMIGGQWMGGLFADTLGWQAAFVVLVLVFGSVAWLMRAALSGIKTMPTDSGSPQKTGFTQQIPTVLKLPWARQVLLYALLEGALVFSAIVFIPSYLHDRFNLPLTAAGAIVALYGIGGLGYTLFARRLLGRFGEHGLSRFGGLMIGLGFVLLVVGSHWAWSLPACLISGFGFYMLHNTLQANATQMAPQARGTAVALFACSLFLGQSLGIGAASSLIDSMGLQVVFSVCMISLPVLGYAFAWALKNKRPVAL